MSDKVKAKIGEELYAQVLEKGLKPEDFDLVNDGSWIPKSRFNELNESKKTLESKVTTLEKQNTDKDNLIKDNEDFKEKFAALNNTYKTDLALKDKEIANNSKRYLVETALTKEGAKHPDLLLGKINLDNLTVEGSNVLGLSDVIKDLKTNYSDLFIEKQTKSNTNKGKDKTPGENNDPFNFQNMINDAGQGGGDVDWGDFASKL